MTPSDHELVAQIREHDARAFEALCLRYGPVLLRHLLSTVHDQDAADDLLQEVWLRVWTRAEQWDGRGTLTSWLRRIATNLALNYLRSVHRRRQQPLERPPDAADEEDNVQAPAWLVDAAALGPEAVLEQAERRALLRRLMGALPAEKREVLRLVHDAEMDTREVAATLGIPEGTVKSRLHYGTKRLAQAWRDASRDQD
jgi:RNA polymerase sigma-70 factor, ECF subfamily